MPNTTLLNQTPAPLHPITPPALVYTLTHVTLYMLFSLYYHCLLNACCRQNVRFKFPNLNTTATANDNTTATANNNNSYYYNHYINIYINLQYVTLSVKTKLKSKNLILR